jgi:hypothetical protein
MQDLSSKLFSEIEENDKQCIPRRSSGKFFPWLGVDNFVADFFKEQISGTH